MVNLFYHALEEIMSQSRKEKIMRNRIYLLTFIFLIIHLSGLCQKSKFDTTISINGFQTLQFYDKELNVLGVTSKNYPIKSLIIKASQGTLEDIDNIQNGFLGLTNLKVGNVTISVFKQIDTSLRLLNQRVFRVIHKPLTIEEKNALNLFKTKILSEYEDSIFRRETRIKLIDRIIDSFIYVTRYSRCNLIIPAETSEGNNKIMIRFEDFVKYIISTDSSYKDTLKLKLYLKKIILKEAVFHFDGSFFWSKIKSRNDDFVFQAREWNKNPYIDISQKDKLAFLRKNLFNAGFDAPSSNGVYAYIGINEGEFWIYNIEALFYLGFLYQEGHGHFLVVDMGIFGPFSLIEKTKISDRK